MMCVGWSWTMGLRFLMEDGVEIPATMMTSDVSEPWAGLRPPGLKPWRSPRARFEPK